jgi:PilZ domain
MLPAADPLLADQAPLTSSERRRRTRYPLGMEVSYRWALRKANAPSNPRTGRTVNISASGILLYAPEVLPMHAMIDLVILWPVSIDDVPLSFIVQGKVVRSDGTHTAVQIIKHEFRTRKTGC